MRHLREQDKTQIAQLHQQYSDDKDKLEDEEKIRSIYHDMKNHLLVLEASQNSEISHKMAKKLYSEISAYDNYIHTGNEFLDIIIEGKKPLLQKRRELIFTYSLTSRTARSGRAGHQHHFRSSQRH